MSRWCFERQIMYRDLGTGLNYEIYIGVEPLKALYEDDEQVKGIREWIRLVIVDTYARGRCLARNPHVGIYYDLEALLRARLHDVGDGRSVFYIRGGVFRAAEEGPYKGPLDHPPDVVKNLHDCERLHNIAQSKWTKS